MELNNSLVQEIVNELRGINPSSFSSIKNCIEYIGLLFNEAESNYGDGPTLLMDLYGETKPELIVAALFKQDLSEEETKTLMAYSTILPFTNSVYYVLKTITYRNTFKYIIGNLNYNIVDLFRNYMVYIKYDKLNMIELMDDIKECVHNMFRINKLDLNLRDSMFQTVDKYFMDLIDQSISTFKDFYNQLTHYDKLIGMHIMFIIVSHIYLNNLIEIAKENPNKIVMRYIYKLKILEEYKNE